MAWSRSPPQLSSKLRHDCVRAAVKGSAYIASWLLILQPDAYSFTTNSHPTSETITQHASADQSSEATNLAIGQVVRRPINGKEVQRFRVGLIAGQYARVVVHRDGVDLIVRVLTGDGNIFLETGNPAGARANISVSLLAEDTTNYLLEITPADPTPPPGAYDITVTEIRDATQNDKERLAAERLYADARHQKQKEPAELKYASAIERWHALGDSYEEANAWQSLANFHKSLGQLANAEFENARALRQQMGDQEAEAYTLNDWAAANRDYGPPATSRAYFGEALTKFQMVRNHLGEASSLYGMAFCDALMGNMPMALDGYQRVLPIRRELRDRAGEARVLNAIGGTYEWLAEPQQALSFYEQASSVWKDIGDRENEANTRNNIGVYYAGRADWQQALENYEYALSVYAQYPPENLSIQRKKADTLDNVALVYESLNAPDRALQVLEEGLAIRKRVQQNRGLGFTEACYGFAYYLLGDLTTAAAHYETALDFQKKAQDARIAQTYTVLGMIYSRTASKKALDLYQKALAIQQDQKTADPSGAAITLDQMGQVYDLIGETQKAGDFFSRALAIWKSLEDQQGEATTRFHLATVYINHDQFEKADAEIKLAISLVESLRSRVASYQLRMKYFSANADFYGLAVNAEMQLYRTDGNEAHEQNAFLLSEAARSRVLRDMLAKSEAASRPAITNELRGQERRLQYQLDAKYALRSRLAARNASAAQRALNDQEIDKLSIEYNSVLTSIRSQDPLEAEFVEGAPFAVADIQRELDKDTAVLEYSLGEKNSYAWTITTYAVKGFELPGRAKIENLAKSVAAYPTARNTIVARETPEARTTRLDEAYGKYSEAAAQLARIILGPVMRSLSAKRLVVVADGALQLIPFAALPVPDDVFERSAGGSARRSKTDGTKPAPRLLIDDLETTNLPSASVLVMQRRETAKRRAASRTVAIFADPVFSQSDQRVKGLNHKTVSDNLNSDPAPQSNTSLRSLADNSAKDLTRALDDVGLGDIPWLPYSRTEAEAIMRLVPPAQSLPALGFKASRATVMLPEIAQYRIIHFATHGVVDLEHPELSGIILSMVNENGQPQDGYLRLYEIGNLNLPAELIVLSACQTGVGKQIKGEGVIALTDSFMKAGAARVVASLWKVDDAATAALMTQFYKEMFLNGLKPAAALRAAQISISKQKRWHSPYFWAGFVLQGEWR